MVTEEERYLLRLRNTKNVSVDPAEGNFQKANTLLMIRPDKPCHKVRESLLSSSTENIDLKGFINIFNALLVLTTAHAALENITKYGMLVDPVQWFHICFYKPVEPSFCITISGLIVLLLCSLGIEVLLSKGLVNEKVGLAMITTFLTLEILIPAVILLLTDGHLIAAFNTSFCTILVFFKLVSYHMTNYWCRAATRASSQNISHQSISSDTERRKDIGNGNVEANLVHYPDNLNIKDFYYFVFAPTLCYELNFPRSDRIRIMFLVKRSLEMLFLQLLNLCLIQQFLEPTFRDAFKHLQEMDYSRVIENILKSIVPGIFILFLYTYFLYHSFLNALAELLRFGDRYFYDDFWNSETVQSFWNKWSMLVHKWSSRHVYIPLKHFGFTKSQRFLAVFLISAVLHEYVFIVSLKTFTYWIFLYMLAQVPYCMIVDKHLHIYFGNIVGILFLSLPFAFCSLMYFMAVM